MFRSFINTLGDGYRNVKENRHLITVTSGQEVMVGEEGILL